MVVCQVCKDKEAEQKHHVSYYPELTIDVCIECHKLIHKHGVGSPGSPDYEIIKDAPSGIRIPLTSARLGLTYRCSECGEIILIGQSLINLLLFSKSLAEPRECFSCNNKKHFVFILEDSSIMTDSGPHSYYVTSKDSESSRD